MTMRHRRGFIDCSLTGLLVVIVLIGVFLLMAGRAFKETLDMTRDVRRAETAASRMDRVAHELRRRVLAAKRVEVDETGQQVTLSLVDGHRYVWRIDQTPVGCVLHETRESGDFPAEDRLWPQLPDDLAFTAEGMTLRLGQRVARSGIDLRLSMTSLVAVLEVKP
ncbi:MAG: hypothetical protein IT440_05220 [Phycisphaeraceae bacterium]|nr:hypothetical protein [Phycisphaeraceae bacterium]